MTSLAGITLVVTRPAAQAGHFVELAAACGARCIAFPTLEIEAVDPGASALGQLRAQVWDWAIFTSANAVEYGWPALSTASVARCAAVGRATARALEARGCRVDARPDSANSEGMLALPEFRDVAGRRVLLVKGEGGRDLMRREFAARGAEVLELAVYRRCQAAPTPDVQRELQRTLGRAGTWIAATSAEVLDALVQLVGDEWRSPLLESALLVPGDRVAGAARQLGWRGPVVTAPTAEDATMLEALRQHVAGPPATP